MKRKMSVEKMLGQLKAEKINTWFDLGLFIDKFKENNPVPTAQFTGSFENFTKDITSGGIAFITYAYSVDGVSIEVEKYAKICRNNFENIPIYYIAGKFFPESIEMIDPSTNKFSIEEINGFDDWTLYKDFFFTKLERGSKEYNALILKFWDQVLTIVEKMGKYVEEKDIKLFYLINVCSNPGNVSLTLATVLISEFLGIPVINNNHDFYWEGGNRKVDIINKGLDTGPRDFFFLNSDIGEFFSIIEILYPWESRSWISVNINKGQTKHLIYKNGHNPANVTEIGTAVDTEHFSNITKRHKINAFFQFEKILSRYKDTLISYSANDVINNMLVDEYNPAPILIGVKTMPLKNFMAENIIFLQPTRIISRKRIEVGLGLVNKLFKDKNFIDKFKATAHLKLTVIVTGPIALGHYEYFEQLITRFSKFLEALSPKFRSKVYLAFLFSELDKKHFKQKFENPVNIPELYNIASLVLLPSKTEGRGLPIIEATACGTPIFCRRYHPENVYSEVIGEHLPEKDRLKVIELIGTTITSQHTNDIVNRVFFPHQFSEEILHNKNVVQKRYSLTALNENLLDIFYKLFFQNRTNTSSLNKTRGAIEQYSQIVNFSNDDLKYLLKTENRHYLPGYGRLTFMLYLKSLIDPSFFRIEEQEIRGMAFKFAQEQIPDDQDFHLKNHKKIIQFYNTVDNIFRYRKGEISIRHDHSFSYRHRNNYQYPYRDYTIQELTGLINFLYIDIFQPKFDKKIDHISHFFTDWYLALAQLTSSSFLAIDNRTELILKLKANVPIAHFPGYYFKNELEFFALQSVRARLKLTIEEELTEDLVKKNAKTIAPIYVFSQEKPIKKWLNYNEIFNYIIKGQDNELKLLYKYEIIKIIKTEQYCVGIHFPQLGVQALKALRIIQKQKGFIISNRPNSSVMTDYIDIDSFHIGKVTHPLMANIMGIPEGSGYIQYIPAGIRTTLAYPTPIQTSYNFSKVLNSKLYKKLCDSYGEKKILDIIKQDAENNGSPVKFVLQNIKKENEKKDIVDFFFVSGTYKDGLPWNGVIANTYAPETTKRQASLKNPEAKEKKWMFATITSETGTKKVTTFIKDFQKEYNKEPKIAWNGGYILNAELVGKLGLPESYIGSPLGLLISENKVISAPLFNKAALLISRDGKLDIRRVNSSGGIIISDQRTNISFSPSQYNPVNPDNNPCFYDLLFPQEEISGDGRIIIRLAGNKIKEIIHSRNKEKIKIIPVGLTLSLPKESFPDSWNKIDKELNIKIPELKDIQHAVEAGPMLLNKGIIDINMEIEGWKTNNSIHTQAARLDYTDMRGPKIAVGLNKNKTLSVLTINGRIRESVGATHIDMAEIMQKFEMEKAMGFDPGGSSTLVVNGKTLNISPYNKNYENNTYSLPPTPRAVSNAVVGYIE